MNTESIVSIIEEAQTKTMKYLEEQGLDIENVVINIKYKENNHKYSF